MESVIGGFIGLVFVVLVAALVASLIILGLVLIWRWIFRLLDGHDQKREQNKEYQS